MSGPQDANRRNGQPQAPVERAGEVSDLAAAADEGADAASGGRAVERGPDDDHCIGRVGREGALSALAQSRPGVRAGASSVQDGELVAARAEIARLEETVKEQAIELVGLAGKNRGPQVRRRAACRAARTPSGELFIA
jgi:hypothetical protein